MCLATPRKGGCTLFQPWKPQQRMWHGRLVRPWDNAPALPTAGQAGRATLRSDTLNTQDCPPRDQVQPTRTSVMDYYPAGPGSRRRTSSGARPRTRRSFSGRAPPRRTWTPAGRSPSAPATRAQTALLAAPFSGGLRTATFSRSPRRPTMRSRDAPGTTLTARTVPSGWFAVIGTGSPLVICWRQRRSLGAGRAGGPSQMTSPFRRNPAFPGPRRSGRSGGRSRGERSAAQPAARSPQSRRPRGSERRPRPKSARGK